MNRRHFLMLLPALAGCELARDERPRNDADRAALLGTWIITLADGVDDSIREEVVLRDDGQFESELTLKVGSNGQRYTEGGTWYLHGQQLKRFYTVRDGQQLGRKKQSYATLEITGPIGAREFLGRNNVTHRVYRFERRVPGTQA